MFSKGRRNRYECAIRNGIFSAKLLKRIDGGLQFGLRAWMIGSEAINDAVKHRLRIISSGIGEQDQELLGPDPCEGVS